MIGREDLVTHSFPPPLFPGVVAVMGRLRQLTSGFVELLARCSPCHVTAITYSYPDARRDLACQESDARIYKAPCGSEVRER